MAQCPITVGKRRKWVLTLSARCVNTIVGVFVVVVVLVVAIVDVAMVGGGGCDHTSCRGVKDEMGKVH